MIKTSRYPLVQGMRVQRSGSLRRRAQEQSDTEMADLTEYLLRSKEPGTGRKHRGAHISAALPYSADTCR